MSRIVEAVAVTVDQEVELVTLATFVEAVASDFAQGGTDGQLFADIDPVAGVEML